MKLFACVLLASLMLTSCGTFAMVIPQTPELDLCPLCLNLVGDSLKYASSVCFVLCFASMALFAACGRARARARAG